VADKAMLRPYHVVEDGTMGKWHAASGETCQRSERGQESESQ
jgi:hypothetical protein